MARLYVHAIFLSVAFGTASLATAQPVSDLKAAARSECERLRGAEVEAAYAWDGKGTSPILAIVAKRESACTAYEQLVDRQRQADEAEESRRKSTAEEAARQADAAEALRREVAAEALAAEEDEARRRHQAELEEMRQIEALRKPIRRTAPARGLPRCKKGKPCGRSCIAKWKTCHK